MPTAPHHLIAYALPALPLAALVLPVYVFLPSAYAQVGLPLAGIGIILLLARLWDGVTDPLVGVLSDRTVTRFGRRKPWIAAGLPLTLISLWYLMVPGDGVGPAYLLCWSFMLFLGWTMMIVPLNAWGAELSGDYHQRTRIAGFREGASIIGTVLALTLPFAIGVGAAGQERDALRVLAICILVMLPLFTVIALVSVPEYKAPAKPPLKFRRGLKVIFANGAFRKLIAAYLINGMANGLPAQLFLFYVQHLLMEGERAGLLLLSYFMSGLITVPLWLWLSGKYGKHVVWRWAMMWNIAWFLTVPFLGPGDFTAFLIVCLMTGMSLGADLILPSAMQADVVDLDTARTGRARTGLYFAFWGLATKLATALAALGLTVAGLFGFDALTGGTDTGKTALLTLYALAPVALKIVAIAILWRWPIDAATQAALRARIAART
ncbi:MFS transporter [Niveispirillum lacus]|uniref:MFS transporter n=1 Tax=Niveispirillum lacus TaxID=1981099 RepID=A0A255YW29_9PROT|nr:MFS transporter [Niveispirillum lacus]OYQ33443.1 MFS transporter [Niveispirillum lacus]